MNAPTSVQPSALVTEKPPAPGGPAAQRAGDGHAVIHRSLSTLLGGAPEAPLPSTPQRADDWAICCSGGGIRSATYCLGGLQSLDEGGLLSQARWIVGVSGGSYIAASRALVAHHLRRRRAAGPPAYARGSAEEDNLRNNTRYIAPDAKTVLVAVLSLLLGAAVTAILVLAPLYAFGHAWGWLLHAQGVLTWSGGKASASVSAWTWWLAPAIAAGITLALFGYWWLTLVSGSPGRGARRARLVGWSATITTAIAVLMLAVPLVIDWLYHSTGPLGTVVHFFGFGGSGHWTLATFSALIAAIVAVARSSQKQLAKLSPPGAGAVSSSNFAGQLVTWARAKLAPWITSIVIIAVGALITVLWIGTAARVGYSPSDLVPVLVAVAIVVATRCLVDINRTSLHDIYRWRLADAYAVTREAAEATAPEERQRLFAEAARTRLSDLRGDDSDQDGPQLVIACTANINADRTVPPGRGGFCLAFDPEKVTLRGDPSCDEPDVEVDTTDYEHLLGHTRFTLFDVVAISGAAFSPLMGSATRGASRIMMTLTDLRLGVWLPHPTVVERARAYAREHGEENWRARRVWQLLAWYVLPHPSRRQDPGKRKQREQREAELWAHVLKLREGSAEAGEDGAAGGRQASGFARLQAAVCWRVMQPTLALLWAEAAGHTSYRATWVNVTDGGHYDNLGLVEVLRRKARNVVVLDASGDNPHTWYTLGGAMRLAWAEAGVDITLDPTKMIAGASGLGKTQVLRPWARGTFTRPDLQAPDDGQAPADGQVQDDGQAPAGGQASHDVQVPVSGPAPDDDGQAPGSVQPAGAQPTANGQRAGDRRQLAVGNLWVCKLGWWDGAPWDIRAYAGSHSTYPCDPTMQQLYDGAEFDAYHELGSCAVIAAAAEGKLPLR